MSMSEAHREHKEHQGHIAWREPWCRLCQEETKKELAAAELEKDRELHGRMADAYFRRKNNGR